MVMHRNVNIHESQLTQTGNMLQDSHVVAGKAGKAGSLLVWNI